MDFHRWTDRSQPQTLYSVVILFYINAAIGLLGFLGLGMLSNASYATGFVLEILHWVGIVHVFAGQFDVTTRLAAVLLDIVAIAMVASQALAGLAIANERKWGYHFAVALCAVELAGLVLAGASFGTSLLSFWGLMGLLFIVIMLALLLHPQSREYRRIWFR